MFLYPFYCDCQEESEKKATNEVDVYKSQLPFVVKIHIYGERIKAAKNNKQNYKISQIFFANDGNDVFDEGFFLLLLLHQRHQRHVSV